MRRHLVASPIGCAPDRSAVTHSHAHPRDHAAPAANVYTMYTPRRPQTSPTLSLLRRLMNWKSHEVAIPKMLALAALSSSGYVDAE